MQCKAGVPVQENATGRVGQQQQRGGGSCIARERGGGEVEGAVGASATSR